MTNPPRKKPLPPRGGYAGTPGKGPARQSCGTCLHAVAHDVGHRTFYQCALRRADWSGGYRSDIVLKSPACEHWKSERP